MCKQFVLPAFPSEVASASKSSRGETLAFLVNVVGVLLRSDPVSEIEDELVVDGGVDVLGQLHEEEPVAIVDLADDGLDVHLVVGLGAVAEQHCPAVDGGQADHAEDHVDSGPDGNGDVPEPQEDVDLLVDDVVGQHTEAVLVLHCTRGTIL